MAAIGGNTVAFMQRSLVGNVTTYEGIRVVDVANPGQSLLLTPSSTRPGWPSISPDGNLVVWSDCADPTQANCQALKAVRAGGTWGAPEVVANGTTTLVDTDGSYIVYDRYDAAANAQHIYIQSSAGGPEAQLAIPGSQYVARIDAGVISFLGRAPSGSSIDVDVYVIATNTLYRVFSTATSAVGVPIVSVLSNGQVRVVWGATDGIYSYAYARTFTPAAAPTFAFGGFLAPVQGPPTVNVAKAGAAIPVKFSLGGDRGLNIFAGGSPSSVMVTCNAVAPTGTVDQTLTAGSSGLSYDASSDTYSYIWKTDKAWARSCRRLTLRFVDGTVANADFEFR
jgi:hypothetical protein